MAAGLHFAADFHPGAVIRQALRKNIKPDIAR
jgi:hypothetical protein